MKPFDYNKYLNNNPLLKEAVYIKGVGKDIKDLNYTLNVLQSVYNISRQDMEALAEVINSAILKG
jgi:hypothetical protein